MDDALVCYITDDRHTVETLALLVGTDEAYARQFAVNDLTANPHHRRIEAWAGSVRLFVIDREDLAGIAGEGRAPEGLDPEGLAPQSATADHLPSDRPTGDSGHCPPA